MIPTQSAGLKTCAFFTRIEQKREESHNGSSAKVLEDLYADAK
jgi:hypothetical protein